MMSLKYPFFDVQISVIVIRKAYKLRYPYLVLSLQLELPPKQKKQPSDGATHIHTHTKQSTATAQSLRPQRPSLYWSCPPIGSATPFLRRYVISHTSVSILRWILSHRSHSCKSCIKSASTVVSDSCSL
jgi:hypothetical protein